MQVKLLRALQEREIRRVGETRARPVDVRILSATNRDLKEEMQAGRFRQDLYFRLHVIALPVPPLRDRLEDVLPLARFFLKKQTRAIGSPATGFSREAAGLLRGYAWPGNVRELQNAVEHALALCMGEQIGVADLPEELQLLVAPAGVPSLQRLADVEREHILGALKAHKGNRAKAARWLGISTSTMYRKLRDFDATGEPEVEEALPVGATQLHSS
jgi:DNA-binding NtrC family response regulator